MLVFLLVALVVIFLFPLLSYLGDYESYSRLFRYLWLNERGGHAFSRTLFFATAASILEVLLAFVGALALRRLEVFTKLGRALSLMLVPALMGSLSVAFFFKVQLMNSQWFEETIASRSFIPVWGTLLLIEFWQHGLLFLYLLWLRLQSVPKNSIDFAHASQLTSGEIIRDVYWPHCRNLVGLLLLVGFLFACQEYSKSAILFKPSIGTQTELANHWLERNYNLDLNTYKASVARDNAYKNSAALVMVILLTVAGLVWLLLLLTSIAVRIAPFIRSNKTTFQSMKISLGAALYGCLALSFTLLPLILAVRYLRPGYVSEFSELWHAALLTLTASLLAFMIAGSTAIAARIAAPTLLQEFNGKSLWVFIILYLLQAVPAICLGLCGYDWIALLGHSSPVKHVAVWLIAQSILVLPMLGGFLLWIHFRVSNRELEYQQIARLSLGEVTLWTFFKRFKLEYLLVVIFAFSFIWNEDTINRIMSDVIPSIVDRLGARITGRGASYSEAATLSLFSLSITLLMVIIWNSLLSRAFRREEER